MTAAERAEALLAGRDIDCPRCGTFPMRQQEAVDLGPFFGGVVPGQMVCDASRALCSVSGAAEDPSAAIHILDCKLLEGENP